MQASTNEILTGTFLASVALAEVKFTAINGIIPL